MAADMVANRQTSIRRRASRSPVDFRSGSPRVSNYLYPAPVLAVEAVPASWGDCGTPVGRPGTLEGRVRLGVRGHLEDRVHLEDRGHLEGCSVYVWTPSVQIIK